MKILVLNSGSSSLKFEVFDKAVSLAAGLVEKIGEEGGSWFTYKRHSDRLKIEHEEHIGSHTEALAAAVESIMHSEYGIIAHANEIEAVGHRVVHGGEMFRHTTLITDEVKKQIAALCTLAPLHNPANLLGIEASEHIFPLAKQVAVFDTAFYSQLPAHSYTYPLPLSLYQQHGLRAYGFHGTSHMYVSRQAAIYLNKPLQETSLVSLHLGNGASATAVKGGVALETSMGYSPLSGLMMGTRPGDLDPGVILTMAQQLQMNWAEIDTMLNRSAGLKGICGTNDMRSIVQRRAQGDPDATLALAMYVHRIQRHIGALLAVSGPIDALIFTAGVGENSSLVRQLICHNLKHLGIETDPARNESGQTEISPAGASVKVLVIPTNEELEICQQSEALLSKAR